MARNNGRWGRLRRVLNEDLSSTSAIYGAEAGDHAPGDTPRYGAGANIENHPQVTDYVPRRFRVIGTLLLSGIAMGIVAETVAHHAGSLAAVVGVTPESLTETLSNRLAAWTLTMVLVAAAAYARIVFLLKRHRLSDTRGRYRVWRTVGFLSIAGSACIITGLPNLVGNILGHVTGWHPLGSDATWWLIPGMVLGGWVMTRMIVDAAECRSALVTSLAATLSFLVAAITVAGYSIVPPGAWTESLVRSLPLAGCLGILATCLLTARYVVLDVQGLIEHEDKSAAIQKASSRTAARSPVEPTATVADDTQWTDGSEPDYDYSEDDRPLSKAERKRLRKQQQGRYRAA